MDANVYRRAAMIVSSLDRQSADEVLERLPEDQSQAIRDQMISLNELSPSERDRVIDDFLRARADVDPNTRPFGHSTNSSTWSAVSQGNPAPLVTTSSFQELLLQEDDVIATAIAYERTSVVAGLLNAMPGKRAASVLRRLPVKLQSRAVAALNLGITTKQPMIDVVSDKICDKQAESNATVQLSMHHRDALQAIFDELSSEERAKMLGDLEQEHPMLAQRLRASVSFKPNDCYC